MTGRAETHDLPLAHRLINEAVRTWLNTNLTIAACASEPEEQAVINRIRHLHLAGFDYAVTPTLVEQLARAGIASADAEASLTAVADREAAVYRVLLSFYGNERATADQRDHVASMARAVITETTAGEAS